MDNVLHIAEILYESGTLRFRYTRKLSHEGDMWIRHGLFTAYYENGQLASEGTYDEGLELGQWREFHDNGQLAAEGRYVAGKEQGIWRFWDRDGKEEQSISCEHGEL